MLSLEMFSKTICLMESDIGLHLTESDIGLHQILPLFPKCGVISVTADMFRSQSVPMTIVRALDFHWVLMTTCGPCCYSCSTGENLSREAFSRLPPVSNARFRV